jgi:hypothetical protein
MQDKHTFDLPLTAKAKAALVCLSEHYNISNADISALLIEHLATMSPAEQMSFLDSLPTGSKTELFPFQMP